MSEAGFTKGPWTVADGFPSVESAAAPHLALCNDPSIPMGERMANANLIAAAPDLLAACKAQHEALDYLMACLIRRDPEFLPTKSRVWDAVVLGNSAIAKAQGK